MGMYEVCEGCDKPIGDGEPHCCDWINGIALCEACCPTWQDFKDAPGSFVNGQDDEGWPVYHTAETAAPVIDAHIAAGGAMTDKIGLVSDAPTPENCN